MHTECQVRAFHRRGIPYNSANDRMVNTTDD